jgi:hypothetical protein
MTSIGRLIELADFHTAESPIDDSEISARSRAAD